MKLFSYWRSSCSWRVRIALAYKNVPHTLVPVHLVQGGGEQHGAEHVARNPSAQVPVLEIDANGVTQHLGQSLPILEYLEECHPHPALLPADPSLRARARQMAELVNSGIQPLQNLSVLQRLKNVHSVDEGPWAAYWIARGLTAMEQLASAQAQDLAPGGARGQFLIGNAPTLADVCLVPQLYNARRYQVDLAPYPTLVRVEAACHRVDAFVSSHPDRQPDAVPAPAR